MARKLQADGDAILLAGDDRRLQVVALGGGTGVSVAFRYLLRYMKTQYQETIQKIPES
eukprot:COSAG05_NODE_17409_length_325_cov_1.743363_1_plen_58_part_00